MRRSRRAGVVRALLRSANPARASRPGSNPGVAAALGPGSVRIGADHVRVGDGWAATLIVAGYPAEVGMSWLEPLLQWPGRLDIAVHIQPLPAAAAASRVRKQRARLESARRIDADRGRLDDPQVEASAEDAAQLADLIARGESRLFEVAIYLTVHAHTRADLAESVAEVRAAAASVLLDTHPATWRQLQGWVSTLPLGHDGLVLSRVMDTDALAASFPLSSPDLPGPLPGESDAPGGVLYGVNPVSGGVVWWDRWAQDNFNSVVLARSGAGKSYLMKLEVLRNLYDRVQVAVIDPEDEYVALAVAVGGNVVQLGAPGVRLNPLDIPPGDRRLDALTRRALFLHTLVALLLGQQPPPAERAALDRAITATYAGAGITSDPATWARPAPLLRDLAATLARHGGDTARRADGEARHDGARDGHRGGARDSGRDGHSGHLGDSGSDGGGGHGRAPDPGSPAGGDSAAATLAARLSPWTDGSFRDLFDGPTTVAATGHLVVWSTRHLPDEQRAVGMLLALDAIWRDIDTQAPYSPSTTRLANPLGNQSGQLGNQSGQLGNQSGQLGNQSDGLPMAGARSGNSPVGWPTDALPPPGAWRTGGRSPTWTDPHASAAAVPRRLVVVDEAWTLMRESEGARFLARMAKSARKRRAGLAVVTQDAADLLGSDLGQVVVANAATQILLRQAPQAIDEVAATFSLTAAEARLLLSAERGHALLLAGRHRIGFEAVASPAEHALAAGWADLAGHDPDAGAASYRPDPYGSSDDDPFWR